MVVEPVLPPKGSDTTWFEPSSASGLSLASSVLLHQPPSSGRPLPLTPRDAREARPGPMRARHWADQPIRGQLCCVSVSASSTPVAAMLHPSAGLTALMSQFESRVQEPETRSHQRAARASAGHTPWLRHICVASRTEFQVLCCLN